MNTTRKPSPAAIPTAARLNGQIGALAEETEAIQDEWAEPHDAHFIALRKRCLDAQATIAYMLDLLAILMEDNPKPNTTSTDKGDTHG